MMLQKLWTELFMFYLKRWPLSWMSRKDKVRSYLRMTKIGFPSLQPGVKCRVRFSSRSSRSLWSVLAKWNLKKTSLFFNETLESLGDKIGQMTSGGFFTSPQHAITFCWHTNTPHLNMIITSVMHECTVHYSIEVALTISNILRLYRLPLKVKVTWCFYNENPWSTKDLHS